MPAERITIEAIKTLLLQTGFWEVGVIPTAEVRQEPTIREICVGNTCRNYGTSWACPPAVGTLEECMARCREREYMLLFSNRYLLEDPFDFEGMSAGMRDFKRLVDALDAALKDCLQGYLLLSNEGCGRCKKCTYPDAPCRFPEKLFHSIEGYGFIVGDLAKQAGIKYNNGKNTVTFFGALLLDAEE